MADPLQITPVEKNPNQSQTFTCNRCGRMYSQLKSLRRHVFHCGRILSQAILSTGDVHYVDENGDERQFLCPYCSKAYRWKKGLKVHQERCPIKLAHENPQGQNAKAPAAKKKEEVRPSTSDVPIPAIVVKEKCLDRYQCILCGKSYNWLKNLRRHHKMCRKKVISKRWKECKVMLEPMRQENQGTGHCQKFKCEICQKEFKWLNNLKEHKKNCKPRDQEENEWIDTETLSDDQDTKLEIEDEIIDIM